MSNLDEIGVCECCGTKSARLRFLDAAIIPEIDCMFGYAPYELYDFQQPLREERDRLLGIKTPENPKT